MKDVSFLCFSCVHAPLHDPEAMAWLTEQIAKRKPDVLVHMGDGMEMAWASSHPSQEPLDALEEYEVHNNLLVEMRKASPKSRRIFLPGNHEARLESPKIDDRIKTAMHYRKHQREMMEHWEFPVKKYEYCRHKGVFRIGQVTFFHGVSSSASGLKKESTFLAREWGLYCHGHTHRPSNGIERVVAGSSWNLNWWRACPGCMRHMNPDWMAKEDKSRWGQGLVAGRAQLLKSPRAKRCWEAELDVFRTYDEWREV